MTNVRNRVLAEKREEGGRWIIMKTPLPTGQPIRANWCETGTITITSSVIITSGSPDFQQRIQQYEWEAVEPVN